MSGGLPLSVPLWLPLLGGLLALIAAPLARWFSLVATMATLGFVVGLVLDHSAGSVAAANVTDVAWIPAFGVRYSLGVDGVNVWLLLLAAGAFAFAGAWAGREERERPGLFFLWMGLAQTGVLGALMAQDLILFIAFFDLMLVPFLFLTAGWGGKGRGRAVTRLFVYTLVGSLLMLVGAVATGVLAAGNAGEPLSFALGDIERYGVPAGSQGWLFLCFAVAFLVKMPLFPLHGWMQDGYRAMPLPVLAVFSGVLSKVAAYGFVAIAIPLLPEGAASFQTVLLVLAVVSILYGSAMAFTATTTRLVLAWSSMAQMGFIVLGIASLRPDGAAGALLQSVNHGLVTLPALFIVAVLAVRAGGSEDLRDLGGAALKAPILAALFLVSTFALLAMPGTANFVGEFLILRGAWEASIPLTVLASLGVVMAAAYALRLFVGAMHRRESTHAGNRELSAPDGLLLAIPVAAIVALALVPNVVLRGTELGAARAVLPAGLVADPDRLAADTERSGLARRLAAAAQLQGGSAAGGAPAGGVDPAAAGGGGGAPVDPSTGQPVDPAAAGGGGAAVDPSTGQPVDPAAAGGGGGAPVDPSTGQPVDPSASGSGR